jgi:hypothetical protein
MARMCRIALTDAARRRRRCQVSEDARRYRVRVKRLPKSASAPGYVGGVQQQAVSRQRVSLIRTYTSWPVQPSATASRYSSPSSAQTMRAVIGTGWLKVCSGSRAPVELNGLHGRPRRFRLGRVQHLSVEHTFGCVHRESRRPVAVALRFCAW